MFRCYFVSLFCVMRKKKIYYYVNQGTYPLKSSSGLGFSALHKNCRSLVRLSKTQAEDTENKIEIVTTSIFRI